MVNAIHVLFLMPQLYRIKNIVSSFCYGYRISHSLMHSKLFNFSLLSFFQKSEITLTINTSQLTRHIIFYKKEI